MGVLNEGASLLGSFGRNDSGCWMLPSEHGRFEGEATEGAEGTNSSQFQR